MSSKAVQFVRTPNDETRICENIFFCSSVSEIYQYRKQTTASDLASHDRELFSHDRAWTDSFILHSGLILSRKSVTNVTLD